MSIIIRHFICVFGPRVYSHFIYPNPTTGRSTRDNIILLFVISCDLPRFYSPVGGRAMAVTSNDMAKIELLRGTDGGGHVEQLPDYHHRIHWGYIFFFVQRS